MTRVKVTKAALEKLIKATKDGDWFVRARKQTKAVKAGTARPEFPNFWTEIKKVYIKLQGGGFAGKCAYCEKWLEADTIEHDVEHFRPKARVSRWNVPAWFQQELTVAGVTVNQPASGHEPGYRLLAYHMFNYATACKQCNSVLKKNLFPIKGARRSHATDPATLKPEGAFLIYPIGDLDDDPEMLIEFDGISPQAQGTGFNRLRALATIELFRLDDWRTRKSLIQDRAESIEKLWFALRQRDGGGPAVDVDAAKKAVTRMTSPRYRHANCLRSFHRLYQKNPAEARSVYEGLLKRYLDSYKPR